ncbi:MAG TPA: PQQ-binding-like beta-propeller repeat protein [Thermomicrobiales bacterium]|nr:PQQ-binding-like beta-propeller repeat protein [Thermomicrobiales bacterium]
MNHRTTIGQGGSPPCPATIPPKRASRSTIMRPTCWAAALALLLALATPFAVIAANGWTAQTGAIVYAVATNAEGSLIVSGRRDNTVVAHDATGNELWTFPTNGTVYDLAVSDDGSRIAVASEDRNVYLLDGTGKKLWQHRGPQTFISVSLTGDGAIVAAGSEDKTATVFDKSGKVSWTYTAGDQVTALALYGGGGGYRLLVGSRDSRVALLSGSGQLLWRQTLNYGVRGLGVTANGAEVVVGDNRGALDLLDGASGKVKWEASLGSPVPAVGISRDGALIVAGTESGELSTFDKEGKRTQQATFGNAITDLALDRNAAVAAIAHGEAVALVPRAADGAFQVPKPASRFWHYALPVLIAVAVLALALVALGMRKGRSGDRVWRGVAHRQRKRAHEMRKAWLSYLFLLPTVILLLIFSYYPAFSGIFHSFTEWSPGSKTKWVGLDQFRYLANNRYFWTGIGNLLIFIGTGFLKLLIPLAVAEMIFHLHSSKVRYAFRTMFVIQVIVPGVVGVLLWVNVYDPNIGLANQVLRAAGLDGLARYWLGDANTAIWAIVFMGFPWVSAFALLIFYGGLISIPGELFDAAALDGASTLRRIVNLDLPLLLGQIRLLVILTFIAMVQEFTAVFLTTGGGPGSATYVPSLELYYQAVRFNNFGAASAIGAVLFIIILGGTILNLRYVKSSVEYST